MKVNIFIKNLSLLSVAAMISSSGNAFAGPAFSTTYNNCGDELASFCDFDPNPVENSKKPNYGINLATLKDVELEDESVLIQPTYHNDLAARCCAFAQAVYPKKKNILDSIEKTSEGVFRFFADQDKKDQAGAVIVTKDKGRHRISISFRGTANLSDWLTNLHSLRSDADFLGLNNGALHSGFKNRYLNTQSSLFQALQSGLLKIQKNGTLDFNKVDIEITGHSMGGAMATIAAADVHNKLSQIGFNFDAEESTPLKGSNFKLVTIASPKVFNDVAAREFENRVGHDNIFRVYRDGDVVPMVPLNMMGFDHVGMVESLPAVSYNPKENHVAKHFVTDAKPKSPRSVKGSIKSGSQSPSRPSSPAITPMNSVVSSEITSKEINGGSTSIWQSFKNTASKAASWFSTSLFFAS